MIWLRSFSIVCFFSWLLRKVPALQQANNIRCWMSWIRRHSPTIFWPRDEIELYHLLLLLYWSPTFFPPHLTPIVVSTYVFFGRENASPSRKSNHATKCTQSSKCWSNRTPRPHEQLRDVILIFFYDNRNDATTRTTSATLSQLGSETNRFSCSCTRTTGT